MKVREFLTNHIANHLCPSRSSLFREVWESACSTCPQRNFRNLSLSTKNDVLKLLSIFSVRHYASSSFFESSDGGLSPLPRGIIFIRSPS